MSGGSKIVLPTRQLDPELQARLLNFKPGDRIRVVQLVTVGTASWNVELVGAFHSLRYLQTGITTQRVQADDVIVPVVFFTKDNLELTSITLDERTQVFAELPPAAPLPPEPVTTPAVSA
jgi:hypothetical protein